MDSNITKSKLTFVKFNSRDDDTYYLQIMFHKELKKLVFVKHKNIRNNLQNEIKILNELNDVKGVIKMIEYNNDMIIFPFYPKGDLFTFVKNECKMIKETKCIKIFLQILSIVEKLHQKNIIHRDIKLENFLIDSNDDIILIDFEFAIKQNDLIQYRTAGSLQYISPEMLYNENYNVKTDIWSLGVLLHVLVTKRYPFSNCTSHISLAAKLCNGHSLPKYNMSETMKKLIDSMLIINMAKRPDVTQLIHSIQNTSFNT